MLARARARAARVDILMLTVDSITGGNRECDKRSGFGIAFRLKPAALLDFALKPRWTLNSLCGKKLTLPQLDAHAIWAAPPCRSAAISAKCAIRS